MSTIRAVSMPSTVIPQHHTAVATPRPTPRPIPDTFSSGPSLAALKAKLRRAEDLMAFRLGTLRATVFTAPAENLSDAAIASKQPELQRAGRALQKSNERQVAATFRREHLEAQLLLRPTDSRLVREVDAARERELALTREMRSDRRDVQRLMSSVDVETLARIETPLRGLTDARTLEGLLAEVKTLRARLESRH